MKKTNHRAASGLILLLAILSLAGCASGSGAYSQNVESMQTRAPARALPGSYVLGANDQIHVQVYNEPTVTGDYTIDGAGILSVPAAGRVRAAGLTTEQLERRLTAKLNSGILKDARVTVQVSNYAPFYIRGEVKKPGEFPYRPGLTLGDAVALAGGYTYRADESRAYVRPAGAGSETTRSLAVDPPIAPGDNIRIPERFL
jgi:protein involved in polysaccharide export with SLBB domain